jgi:uncharacterized protein (TIGR02271 family)
MNQTVIGVFSNASEAQHAAQQLERSGFDRSMVDVSTRPNMTYSDLDEGTRAGSTQSMNTGTSTGTRSNETTHRSDHRNQDDGFGEQVSRFFRSLFDDDDETRTYSDAAQRGAVVSVHTTSMDDARRAVEILDDCGAIDVDAQGRAATSGIVGGTTTTGAGTGQSDITVPVVEEELQVGKREVETGGVRLRSRIIERPVEESLRLRHERVTVERTPVNRLASEYGTDAFQEKTIEVTEHAEVPVVSKEARVVEEISIRKDVAEREETIRDTVRRTDVEMEDTRADDLTRNDFDDLDDNRNRSTGL